MKVYTASTRTATSVAKKFKTTKNAPAFKPERKTLFEWQIKSKYLNFFQCPGDGSFTCLDLTWCRV